jgi:hypothetical protein
MAAHRKEVVNAPAGGWGASNFAQVYVPVPLK